MSTFLLLVCSFQIYSGLMKWVALLKQRKRLRNGHFQIVVSVLYALYPIFFLIFIQIV